LAIGLSFLRGDAAGERSRTLTCI